MNCFECNNIAEIKKYKIYLYTDISLENIQLLNAEVLDCSACREESLLLKAPLKIHKAIGLAVVLQPARLSGADIRFLRRNLGYSLKDWAKRLGIPEGTYTKYETSRNLTNQTDMFIRTHYLNALNQKYPSSFPFDEYVAKALSLNVSNQKDFVIAVDDQSHESGEKYLPFNSPLLAKPETSPVEAKTLTPTILAVTIIKSGHKARASALNRKYHPGDTLYVCNSLASAA